MRASISARTLSVFLPSVLLPVAALTVFTPFYQTNDDIAMRLLAEGNFVPGDEPLPYLMFINIIVGKTLSILYRATATLPWYDLFLGGAMIAAAAALLESWRGPIRPRRVTWALLFAIYFLLPAFVSVQFSLAGMACAAGGMSLIARAALTDLPHAPFRFHVLAGTSLFFGGSLIRFEGAALIAIQVALLSLPLIPSAIRNPDQKPRLRVATLAAFSGLLLAVTAFAFNQLAYRQARGWKTFYEYNFLRARLAEYITPDRLTAEATTKLAKQVGWSENDFTLFRNWFFTDPSLFSLDKVRQAERLFYAAAPPQEPPRNVYLKRNLELSKSLFAETRWALLLMGAFLFAHGATRKLTLYFAGMVLTLWILMLALSILLKAPPQRIFWPMLMMAAAMLSIAADRWGRTTPRTVNALAVVLAVYIGAVMLPALKEQSDTRRIAAALVAADVEGLRGTGATLFVLHSNAFPYEDFWAPLRTKAAAFDFVGLGASARTPPVQDFLVRTGRTDLPWSLCTEPSMMIIAAPYVPPLLTTFVAEHRGIKVQFHQAFAGQRFAGWKCQRM